MPDYLSVYTPDQDLQVDIGKGHVAGIVLTSTNTTPGACELYNYVGLGPPAQTDAIFLASVTAYSPVICLFNDRFAPRFRDGLWLHLSADCYLTIWHHVPAVV